MGLSGLKSALYPDDQAAEEENEVCFLPSGPNQSPITEADLTASKTTSSLSSILGTLATTTIPILLYKKHKHSGNNREKRSLRRESYVFDDDDDDSSTLYSITKLTAISTISSEYSIPYTSST
ncbi:hypothetical protein PCOAH_00051710 [Plasmodium coatneyi]|uniref:Uncharacterized protein n=1 Tax=Plasmodium coatneyi TaxID=208452 RepID=A0A1B1E7K9_9APIC|nr:hypothetical protein PCOAH_00051710 [Plasmodium coatneyi]ANQ10973.1 hypothetical protein PCOAH_00051710 [Plasmodium coatneyi]